MNKNRTELEGAQPSAQNDQALAQPPTKSAGDTPRSQVAAQVETEKEGGCCQQRLVLPDLATFREWVYGTEAMDHADNAVYVTAKTLIPELYALLQSKAEVAEQ